MSPAATSLWRLLFGFPRVSGDEPALEALDVTERAFSPRERG